MKNCNIKIKTNQERLLKKLENKTKFNFLYSKFPIQNSKFYKTMPTLYTQSSKNIRNTWFLFTFFFVFIIAFGYAFSVILGKTEILFIAVIFSIFSSIGTYWFSDKLVLSMTNAKEVTRENAREIYNIVENLIITAGLPMPKIYVIDDQAMNAFATGRNPENSVICFTRGLLERLNKEEIRGVTAHELSHIGNRDMLIGTMAVVMAGVVAMATQFFFNSGFLGGDREEKKNPLILILSIIFIILAPIFATILRLAISRKREFLADSSATLLTRYPEGLASALEKISGDSLVLQNSSPAVAHLFISNPFRENGITKLFSTHPPIEERIARLRETDLEVVRNQ